jgi:polygalacturonase
VNTANDDAIVLKSSLALGVPKATENITITNCQVSAFDPGTFLDGTFGRTQQSAPDKDGPTGRIKLGTESNGDFRNITISNCVFDHSRGLAIETVDGGNIEDVVITNITMRDVTTAPIFVRLGKRLRAPAGAVPGSIRRVQISDIVVSDAESRFGSIIAGLPDHPIEDLRLKNITIQYRGGGTSEQAKLDPLEKESSYPEPSMFGEIPASGFFIRHVRRLDLENIKIQFIKEDLRPAFVINDARSVEFRNVKLRTTNGIPSFSIKNVEEFRISTSWPIADIYIDRADSRQF